VQKAQPESFTTYGDCLLNVLKNEVGITAFDNELQKPHFFDAVWDTGANSTAITKCVAEDCGLIQTGIVEVRGVTGSKVVPTYLVEAWLPNKVRVSSIKVAEVELPGSADILIGMDIIALDNFVVSSYQEKTSFSFHIPAERRIDLPL